MSILDQLHNGELYPSEQIEIEDESYHKSETHKAEIIAELSEKLKEKEQGLLDELDREYTHILSIIEAEAFKQGFRIAVKLLLDGLS